MWGLYQESVTPSMGMDVMVLIFIVIIIGGLGSVGGCFVGALLVGAGGELRRLPGAQARARLQHPADGADPAVAAAGPLPGGEAMNALRALLSGDPPRSRVLTSVLVAILLGLALRAVPVSRHARRWTSRPRSASSCVLVASYDLLLGYTGIVSFAHTMFFGIGGYGVGLALSRSRAGLDRDR